MLMMLILMLYCWLVGLFHPVSSLLAGLASHYAYAPIKLCVVLLLLCNVDKYIIYINRCRHLYVYILEWSRARPGHCYPAGAGVGLISTLQVVHEQLVRRRGVQPQSIQNLHQSSLQLSTQVQSTIVPHLISLSCVYCLTENLLPNPGPFKIVENFQKGQC